MPKTLLSRSERFGNVINSMYCMNCEILIPQIIGRIPIGEKFYS